MCFVRSDYMFDYKLKEIKMVEINTIAVGAGSLAAKC